MTARGVRVFGISTDPANESATFAAKYAIGFPLLADVDGAVSKQYVGLNYDDTTIPGIVVIRRDGTVAFRQVAETKYDRLSTEQLFAAIDRSLGRSGAAATAGYGVLERVQLHADIGYRAADLAILAGVAPELAIGAWVGTDLRDTLDVDVAAVARIPVIHDVGAIQLTGLAGWSAYGPGPWNASLRVGPWVAITPRWAVHLDVGAAMHGLDDRSAFVTFGVSALLEK